MNNVYCYDKYYWLFTFSEGHAEEHHIEEHQIEGQNIEHIEADREYSEGGKLYTGCKNFYVDNMCLTVIEIAKAEILKSNQFIFQKEVWK